MSRYSSSSHRRYDDEEHLDRSRPSRSSSSYVSRSPNERDGECTPTQQSTYGPSFVSDYSRSAQVDCFVEASRATRYERQRSPSASSYRAPVRDRYEDSFVGSSRGPYVSSRERDELGSLSVDPRVTAIPARRYESYLTARSKEPRRESTARERSGSISTYDGYGDLSSVRYSESAGGTGSIRNARDDDLGRERRRAMGLPSDFSSRSGSSSSGWGSRSISGGTLEGTSRSRSRYDDPYDGDSKYRRR